MVQGLLCTYFKCYFRDCFSNGSTLNSSDLFDYDNVINVFQIRFKIQVECILELSNLIDKVIKPGEESFDCILPGMACI